MSAARVFNRIAKAVWFRPGTVRTAWFEPYAGLKFELSPQVFPARMCIFVRGCEKEVSAELKRRINPGNTVAVVGAHVGMHVLHMAKLLRGQGEVFAFEPWPDNFRALETNLSVNQRRTRNVVAINKAVGGASGWSEMTAGPSDGEHHLSNPGESGGRPVPMTTLDDELADVQLDLLLVDVEGRELDVLEGAEQLLRRCRPTLILEHHGGQVGLTARLAQLGYLTSALGDRHVIAEPSREADE